MRDETKDMQREAAIDDGAETEGHGRKLGPLGQGIWAKPEEDQGEAETEGHGVKLHEYGRRAMEDEAESEVEGHGRKLGPLGQGIWAKPDEAQAESPTE